MVFTPQLGIVAMECGEDKRKLVSNIGIGIAIGIAIEVLIPPGRSLQAGGYEPPIPIAIPIAMVKGPLGHNRSRRPPKLPGP
jgi:hypothetical protein